MAIMTPAPGAPPRAGVGPAAPVVVAGRGVPDVSVIVAVHNTMPYLTRCLTSLATQSIGLERLEILAVDDGSTDGGGRELDRFARRHPGAVTVVHQANSGSPAAPNNRALDMASGRYVLFVGSDDYLGTEALERMVTMADHHGSDIVIGKMVAVGDRSVPRAVFRRTEPRIDLVESGALYAISNTKLFRRALIEDHHLRFSTELPVSSDMPFTLEAYLCAGTISVLADYDCYYAVRRPDDANITYRAAWEDRLRACSRALDLLAQRAGPGALYDEFATRLLKVDLTWLFGAGFLALDDAGRETCMRATAGLLERAYGDAYERFEPRLTVAQRLRFRWVLAGDAAALAELVAMDEAGTYPPTVLEGDRAYARYPGFRDGRSGIPDRAFQLLGTIVGRMAGGTRLLSIDWAEGSLPTLHLRVEVPVIGETGSLVARLAPDVTPSSGERRHARILPADVRLPPASGTFRRSLAADGTATVLEARLPVERPTAGRPAAVLEARVAVDVAGATYEVALRGKGVVLPEEREAAGAGPYRAAVAVDERGRLVVAVRAGSRSLAARVRARLLGRGVTGGPTGA